MKITVYILSILVLLLLSFFLKVENRSFLPIIWMGYGFVYHGFMFARGSFRLNQHLITKHRDFLIQNKISFTDNRFAKRIDMFTLFQERHKLVLISKNIEQKITDIISNLYLTIISFFLFPVFIWTLLGLYPKYLF